MAELGHDLVVTEGPGSMAAQAVDIWVMTPETLESDTHRSVVLDPEGEILGDTQLED